MTGKVTWGYGRASNKKKHVGAGEDAFLYYGTVFYNVQYNICGCLSTNLFIYSCIIETIEM